MDQRITIPWYLRFLHWRRLARAKSVARELYHELGRDLDELSFGLIMWHEKNKLLGIMWEDEVLLSRIFHALSHASSEEVRRTFRQEFLRWWKPAVRSRLAKVEEMVPVLHGAIDTAIREEIGEESLDPKDLERLGLTPEKIRADVFNGIRRYSDRVGQVLADRYTERIHHTRADRLLKRVTESLRDTVPSEASSWTARVWGERHEANGVCLFVDVPQGEPLSSPIDGPDSFFLSPYLLGCILKSCQSSELSTIEASLNSPDGSSAIWAILLSHVRAKVSYKSDGDGWRHHGSIIGYGPGMHPPKLR